MRFSKELYVPLGQTLSQAFPDASTIEEDDENLSYQPKTRGFVVPTHILSLFTGTLLVIVVVQAVFLMRFRATAQSKISSPSMSLV